MAIINSEELCPGGCKRHYKWCRCCKKCGFSGPHRWESWGHYLDADIYCGECGTYVDSKDC